MPVDDRFIRALTEISPDLAEQYMQGFHRTEILESRPPELEVEPVSTAEQRNSDLFFEIADVLDFYPHLYDQQTWGGFDSRGETDQQPSGEEHDLMLVGVKGCSTTVCLAGWAAALSGWHPTIYTSIDGDTTFLDGDTTFLDWEVVAPVPLIPSGHYLTELAHDVARALLGITDSEAEELFSSIPAGCSDENRWTADDLRAIGKGRSVFTDEWPGEDL
jgi:hypothetical protein